MRGSWPLTLDAVQYADMPPGEQWDTDKLRVGPCDRGVAVYSNEPMARVETGPLDWTATIRMAQSVSAPNSYSVDAIRGRRLLDGRGIASLRLNIEEYHRYQQVPATEGAEENFVWGLFSEAGGDPLAQIGDFLSPEFYGMVRNVTWFRWALSPERVAIVDYRREGDGNDSGDYLMVVVIDEEGKLDSLIDLRLSGYAGY